jgi:hypothetical protein
LGLGSVFIEGDSADAAESPFFYGGVKKMVSPCSKGKEGAVVKAV